MVSPTHDAFIAFPACLPIVPGQRSEPSVLAWEERGGIKQNEGAISLDRGGHHHESTPLTAHIGQHQLESEADPSLKGSLDYSAWAYVPA